MKRDMAYSDKCAITEGVGIMVYVLNKDGNPLMPTQRHGAVRRWLNDGKARVVSRCPFTIQLLSCTAGITQPVALGVNAGSKVIGLSATTESKELYSAELALRTDVVKNLSTRREFRRSRRSRKLRYREPRFSNRRKPKGWLAPSVEQKINTHMQAAKQICKMLPISKIIIETAAFDIQKLKDPNITGFEYQQGDQSGFWNAREYVFWRDRHTCQHCRGRSGDQRLNVHHIESRQTGGDAPNNLITLCETCHKAHHCGKIKLAIKRGKSYRHETFMGIMRWALYGRLKTAYPDVTMTYGYITKTVRIAAGLEKSHRVDARCITGSPLAKPLDVWFRQKAVRTRNRQIHKATTNKGGCRKLNQQPKYMYGYQLYDRVKLPDSRDGFIGARRKSGSFRVINAAGEQIANGGISYKKLTLLERRKTILTDIMPNAA